GSGFRWKTAAPARDREPGGRERAPRRSALNRRSPDPAGLGHVDHHAVGPAVLDLDVAAVAATVPDPEGLVHVVARLGARLFELLGDRLQALDLEADVMDAAPALAPLDTGDR